MNNARRVALLGLMAAMVIILMAIERMLPPLPFLPPHFRLGFSNIVVMYVLFFFGKKEAFALVAVKGIYNVLRGVLAGVLSFSGGASAVLAMVLVRWLFGTRSGISYTMLSIVGAVFHNIGQLLVASFFLGDVRVFVYYLPVLVFAGIVMGMFTGAVFERLTLVWE